MKLITLLFSKRKHAAFPITGNASSEIQFCTQRMCRSEATQMALRTFNPARKFRVCIGNADNDYPRMLSQRHHARLRSATARRRRMAMRRELNASETCSDPVWGP
jgi:hypothetical protein